MSRKIRKLRWPGFAFAFWHQWFNPLHLKRMNWIDFNLIGIGFEVGKYKGLYTEISCCLLGVGMRVEIYDKLTRSMFSATMDQRIAEAKDEFGINDASQE